MISLEELEMSLEENVHSMSLFAYGELRYPNPNNLNLNLNAKGCMLHFHFRALSKALVYKLHFYLYFCFYAFKEQAWC